MYKFVKCNLLSDGYLSQINTVVKNNETVNGKSYKY